MQNQTQKVSAASEPRLLDRIRNKCRLLHYSIRTESAYVNWVTRFLRFHRLPDGTWRHPTELTGPEIGRFLTLMIELLYGTGMRLLEVYRQRCWIF